MARVSFLGLRGAGTSARRFMGVCGSGNSVRELAALMMDSRIERDAASVSGQSIEAFSSQRTEWLGAPVGHAITPCGAGISAVTRRAEAS